jgi:hypothetical protein
VLAALRFNSFGCGVLAAPAQVQPLDFFIQPLDFLSHPLDFVIAFSSYVAFAGTNGRKRKPHHATCIY